MADKEAIDEEVKRSHGYHMGDVDTVISVDDVQRQAQAIATHDISLEELDALALNQPLVSIDGLKAGYGKMEILHDFNLRVGKGQSLCLIGPMEQGNQPSCIQSLVSRIFLTAKLSSMDVISPLCRLTKNSNPLASLISFRINLFSRQ